MGWIECVRCEKLQHDFVARTFAIMAPVHPVSTEFLAVTKQSQIHPKTMKRTKTWVLEPMGWIGCVRCNKFWHDFVARNFVLIAPVLYVLHQLSCTYKMIPNASKYHEMHRNISLGSNGVDCIRCEKFWCDFKAQTCALIAPVQPILHQVSCSKETLTKAPKQYETHQTGV